MRVLPTSMCRSALFYFGRLHKLSFDSFIRLRHEYSFTRLVTHYFVFSNGGARDTLWIPGYVFFDISCSDSSLGDFSSYTLLGGSFRATTMRRVRPPCNRRCKGHSSSVPELSGIQKIDIVTPWETVAKFWSSTSLQPPMSSHMAILQ